MIDITKASYLQDYTIRLRFSDASWGDYDLNPIVNRNTALTNALKEKLYFQSFFVECGALCWKNGLELAPAAIHARLLESGKLRGLDQAT
jgi:hypothetical protein